VFRSICMPLIAVAIVIAAASTLSVSAPAATPARGVGPASGRYTVRVPFIVVPPPRPVGATESPAPALIPEDIKFVLARQQFIFEQDGFLLDVLKSQEFHPADKPNNECDWLRTNKSNAMAALRRDLRFLPRPDAGAFQITMTTSDPQEARDLVMAAVKVYEEQLRSDSRMRRTRYLLDLENAVKDKDSDFQLKRDALLDYSKRQQIDVMKLRFESEKSALQTLNEQFPAIDLAASRAEQRFTEVDNLQKAGKEVPLSPELQLAVENDVALKSLITSRLNWEQEKAVVEAASGPNAARLAEVNARLNKIDDQIAQTRKKLIDDARGRMMRMLADEVVSLRYSVDYMGQIRRKKEDALVGLGQTLLVWQQHVDEVNQAGELAAKLRAELALTRTNLAVDDTRVVRFSDPVAPDKVPAEKPNSN
jgi:hypothetical protein